MPGSTREGDAGQKHAQNVDAAVDGKRRRSA